MESKEIYKSPDIQQKRVQNGPLLLSRLQYKVARLEVTLQDRENQLIRLQASAKVTAMNEVKLQAQVYYEEVLRLKSQLNFHQNQCQQPSVNQHRSQPLARVPPNLKVPENKRKEKKLALKQAQSVSKDLDEDALKQTLTLKEDNKRLQEKVSELLLEKGKLEKENFRLDLRNCQDISKLTLLSDRSISPPYQSQEEALAMYKTQITEWKDREKAWEEERKSYKELLQNLTEDHLLFNDVSQEKQHDMDLLQKEVLKLQKEVLCIQREVEKSKLQTKTTCQQCSQSDMAKTRSSSNVSAGTSSSLVQQSGKSLKFGAQTSKSTSKGKNLSGPKRPPILSRKDHPKRSPSRPSNAATMGHQTSLNSRDKGSASSSNSNSAPGSALHSPSHSSKKAAASSVDSDGTTLPHDAFSLTKSSLSKNSKRAITTDISTCDSEKMSSAKSPSSTVTSGSLSTSEANTEQTSSAEKNRVSEGNNTSQKSIEAQSQSSDSSMASPYDEGKTPSLDDGDDNESIDREIAEEILNSRNKIISASVSISSIFESHFRRKSKIKDMGADLPKRNRLSKDEKMDLTSMAGTKQIEAVQNGAATLEAHFNRLRFKRGHH